MKYLITGGYGFIGSNFIKCLLSEDTNAYVHNIDCLTYASNLKNIEHIEDTSKYEFSKININNSKKIKSIFYKFRPDRIVHFAAESHVDNSIEKPENFIKTNILGTYNLLNIATEFYLSLNSINKSNFCFHHISTDEVFGDIEHLSRNSLETDKYNPSSPYSASKAAADQLVKAWGRTYGLPYTITFCTNNFGPNQNKEKLIPNIILKAIKNKKLPIYGDGSQIRSWIYVKDHVDILLKLIRCNKFYEDFNISTDNELKNIELVRKICGLLDKIRPNRNNVKYETLIEHVTDRLGHDRRYGLNNKKIKSIIPVMKKLDFDKSLEETIKFYIN